MKILLISGHGAGDSGACGNGYKEADLTREVVNILKDKLAKYAQVDVYNQARNAFDDVNNGNLQVTWTNYNYVLEIHFNSFNGSAKGTEIYTTRIEKATTKVAGTYWDKIRKADGTEAYVARETYDYETEYKLYLVPINDNTSNDSGNSGNTSGGNEVETPFTRFILFCARCFSSSF